MRTRQFLRPPQGRLFRHNSRLPVKPKSGVHTAMQWLLDKDKRSTVVWSSAAYGSTIIAVYYLWLGFTPAFNLGQASLLLLQAFVVGVAFTFYFSTAIFFPAWAYSLLGIEIDDLKAESRKGAISALARRSIAAQVFGTSAAFLIFAPLPFNPPNPLPIYWAIYWAIAAVLVVFSAIFLVFMPRLSEFNKAETGWSYLSSVMVLGFLGMFGSLLLYVLYDLAPKNHKAEDWFFFLAWVMVTVVSAGIGTSRKNEWLVKILIPLFVFAYLLQGFNVLILPFKGTASAIGIAEPRPVTLIFPPSSCSQMKLALDDPEKLTCDGLNAGVLRDVNLLNTLGDRWVLRYGDSEENITFEGKGVIVKRQPKKKDANPHSS
ncbi:hypothetical protein V8G57_13820 [Collimonas sp. H4R21]|uniref:Uncharacterized protein n=1 Tax=Collimonas rhizosphaerae TaxID=3126357 RepID=A0ABU9PWR1_9BURK